MKQNQVTPKGRKKIRKIIRNENLCAATQEALKEEEERCRRLRDREQQMEDSREVLLTWSLLGVIITNGKSFEILVQKNGKFQKYSHSVLKQN